MENQDKVEQLAQEVAVKYRQMRYTLGSTKKYSIDDIMKHLEEVGKQLHKLDRNRMKERFRQLVGLNRDGGDAHDKLRRDFLG